MLKAVLMLPLSVLSQLSLPLNLKRLIRTFTLPSESRKNRQKKRRPKVWLLYKRERGEKVGEVREKKRGVRMYM